MTQLAPFGFQAGQSRRSVNEYYVAASDTSTLAVGDPVRTDGNVFVGRLPDSRVSHGMLHVTKAAPGQAVRGVVVGIVAGPDANNLQSLPATKIRPYCVLVNDNPQALWDVQANNAAPLSAMAGMYASYAVGAPLGSVSSTVVDADSIGSTVSDLLIAEVLRNDGANSLLRVAFVQHEMAAAGGSPQIGAQIQSLVSGAWNESQQAVIDAGGGLVVADDTGNLTGPGGAISGGGGGGSSTFAGLSDKATVDIPATNTPTATALGLKAPIASPAFTGTPTAPTASPGTNTTQLATTAFVQANAGGAFGPYADTAALESAKPAASNNGRRATVGAAAPYTLYVSNGTAWAIQRAGIDPQAFALANPLSVPVLAFRNNWANYGGATQPLYASLTGGVVSYSGRTKNTGTHSHPNAAFDLPTGFEPAAVSVAAPSVLISSGSALVGSWATFQGAATPPNCLVGVSGGGSTAVFIYDIACSFESSKKLGAAAYKRFDAVSDDVSILFPPNCGSSLKVCMYFHSNGGDYLSHITSAVGGSQTLMRDTLLALLADGWTVISASGGAIASNWGSPASWASTQAVLDWVKSEFSVSKISVLSQSMGGLPGLRALIDYPGITNWYGIFPVCDITTMYATYTATIDTAYGSGAAYTAALPTCNPMQRTTSLFAGKRLRMSHSAADTLVSKTTNSDALLTKVTGVAASVVVTATSGDHGDPSSFIPADIVAHMNL